jgi:hypothetical protein
MKPTEATGHHGTRLTVARAIETTGFRVSKNKHDWLGDGAYFFQDAPLRALEWASNRFKAKDVAVVECKIQIKDFIDLIDIEWASWLSETHDRLLEECRRSGNPIPVQLGRAHHLDREGKHFVVRGVRGAFVDGTPVFPNSALFTKTHVQIAVRDLSLIAQTRILTPEEIRNAT